MTPNDTHYNLFGISKMGSFKGIYEKPVIACHIPPGKQEKTQAQMTGGGVHFSPKGQKTILRKERNQ